MGKIFRGGLQNNQDNSYDSGRRVNGGLTYVPPPEQNRPTSSNGNKKIKIIYGNNILELLIRW